MRSDSEFSKGGGPHNEEVIDAATLSLMALGWIIADAQRADRLLALTGLDVDALRAGVGDPTVLGAVLSFLAEHEPDLIACADAIGASPQALVTAREALTQ